MLVVHSHPSRASGTVVRLCPTVAIVTALLMAAALSCGDRIAAQDLGRYSQSGSAPSYEIQGGGQPEAGGAELQPIEAGQIIARISDQVVLAGDVLPQVNGILKENAARIPPNELPTLRRQLMQQQLLQLIETKLLYAEFLRTIPAENLPRIEETLTEEFERMQLPQLYESTKTNNRAELDTKLREQGSSLDHQQRMFKERIIATQWLSQQVNRDEEITHQQLLADYREHIEEYKIEARARWEEISVRFDRFATKQEAYAALCQLGDQVLLRGAAFADVARAGSHGLSASEGGQHDWTTQGSLVLTVIDNAIFDIPVGQLSKIIEGQNSFHIVRVIERKQAGATPFVEAQEKIRARLRQEGNQSQLRDYLVSLRNKHRVWTVFDDDVDQGGELTGSRTGGDPRR